MVVPHSNLPLLAVSVSVDDLEEISYGQRVFAQEGNLIAFVDAEGYFIEQAYGRQLTYA